jgi:hypothetical protein
VVIFGLVVQSFLPQAADEITTVHPKQSLLINVMPNTQIFSIVTAAITIAGLNLLVGVKGAQAVSFNTNLIVNGDAEAGSAGETSDDVVAVPGWTKTSNFSVYQYDSAHIFPAFTSPGPVSRGNNFFGGGPVTSFASAMSVATIDRPARNQANGVSSSSTAFQTIDLASDAGSIDAGNISFNLSGFLGGYENDRDAAIFVASFLDANNLTLRSASIGPVTNIDRNFTTGLQERATTGLVPIGTRSILVELQMNAIDTAVNSSDNNAYADNLSFVLAPNNSVTSVPEPSEVPGLLIGGALVIGAIKNRQQKS